MPRLVGTHETNSPLCFVCFVLLVFLFILIFFSFPFFFFASRDRGRENLKLGVWEGEEDLGGMGEGKECDQYNV